MTRNVVLIHGAFCGGWCFADIMPTLAAARLELPGAGPAVPCARPGAHARSAARQAEHRRLHARHGGLHRALARAAGDRRPLHGRAHRPAARRPGPGARAGAARARGAVGRAAVDASRDDAGQGADAGRALLGQGAQPILRGSEGGFARQPRSASAAAHLRHVQRRVRASPCSNCSSGCSTRNARPPSMPPR